MKREEILPIAKPILFNTDMVRAILDNRKTETRRIMKPQPILQNGLWLIGFAGWSDGVSSVPIMPGHSLYRKMPYKQGDYLYVRETWSTWTDGYVYKVWTSPFPQPGRYADEFMTWRPSIHMPKEAARIFLRVTGVRIERLQDISNEQILREGIKPENIKRYIKQMPIETEKYIHLAHAIAFLDVWNDTIPKKEFDKYSWEANPWVWVIEFERVEVQ